MEQLTKNQAVATSQEAVQNQDRKSGSAGMPRPISYAVFCLKKKKREVWDLAARVLRSKELNAAFVQRLAPGLKGRFGENFANVNMYPVPILTRDIPGYRIFKHTDSLWKGITVQFYLPPDNSTPHIGT